MLFSITSCTRFITCFFLRLPVLIETEMLRCEDYDEKADVWSYGVVLWEVCFDAAGNAFRAGAAFFVPASGHDAQARAAWVHVLEGCVRAHLHL